MAQVAECLSKAEFKPQQWRGVEGGGEKKQGG